MAYKSNFSGLEIFRNGAWGEFDADAGYYEELNPVFSEPIAQQVSSITLPDTAIKAP